MTKDTKWPWLSLWVEVPLLKKDRFNATTWRVKATIRERTGKTKTYRQIQYWHDGKCVSVGIGSVSNKEK